MNFSRVNGLTRSSRAVSLVVRTSSAAIAYSIGLLAVIIMRQFAPKNLKTPIFGMPFFMEQHPGWSCYP